MPHRNTQANRALVQSEVELNINGENTRITMLHNLQQYGTTIDEVIKLWQKETGGNDIETLYEFVAEKTNGAFCMPQQHTA